MSTWLPGQEGHGAAEVDGEAALHAAEDHAFDAVAGFEFLLELVPRGFAAGAVARQHRFAGAVLDAVDIDFDLVADLEVGLLARRCELAQRNAAFALQADVDHGHVILDPRNGALHHLAFEGFVLAAEAFVEEGREIVAGRECRGRHKVCVSLSFNRACRVRATMASLHMRTWLHALPRRHHAGAASLGWCPNSRRHDKKRVTVPAEPRDTARARQRTGCPRGITARRTARALSSEGASEQAKEQPRVVQAISRIRSTGLLWRYDASNPAAAFRLAMSRITSMLCRNVM